LTKFLAARHHAGGNHSRQRQIPMGASRWAFRDVQPPGCLRTMIWSTRITSGQLPYRALPQRVFSATMGPVLSPLSAFLLLQGIETVAVRIDRTSENAARSRTFCARTPASPGSTTPASRKSPYYSLAEIPRRSHLLADDVRHPRRLQRGTAFYDALKLVKRLVNLGDAKSLACHPASTPTGRCRAENRSRVTPEMIRLSIGIEHIDTSSPTSIRRSASRRNGKERPGRMASPTLPELTAMRQAAPDGRSDPATVVIGLSTTCRTRRCADRGPVSRAAGRHAAGASSCHRIIAGRAALDGRSCICRNSTNP